MAKLESVLLAEPHRPVLYTLYSMCVFGWSLLISLFSFFCLSHSAGSIEASFTKWLSYTHTICRNGNDFSTVVDGLRIFDGVTHMDYHF